MHPGNDYDESDELPLPPDLDLENAIRLDWYTAIDEKLEALVAAAPTPPAWLAAWTHSRRGQKLTPDGPVEQAGPEERLAVWQAVRASGDLPDDAGFYLVADQARFLTELQIGEAMEQIDVATDALWNERGLEEWRSQAPRDSEVFLAFRGRCPATWDRLYVNRLIRHGEKDTARLYQTDRERFAERMERGHDYFYPPPPKASREPPPPWLRALLEGVVESGCISVVDVIQPASICYDFMEIEGRVGVLFSLSPGEWVGGPHDGEKVLRQFRVDVERLKGVFDEVDEVAWRPFGDKRIVVDHIGVSGTYRGHPVTFYLLSRPPDDVGEFDPLPMPSE
jgi:hypothetical protein